MAFYQHKTSPLIKGLMPSMIWSVPTDERKLHLTFDDGPDPRSTPYILSVLSYFDAKASFFVVGQNAERYPDLVHEIAERGHLIGNHTFHHLNGWRTPHDTYVEDFMACETMLEGMGLPETKLFRPPFGRISYRQARTIRKTHSIVMWDLLSGDFDPSLDISRAKSQALKSGPGSIAVFHDNIKFYANLEALLPWYVSEFDQQGYTFETL